MFGTHAVADEDVDSIATGLGGAGLVRRLWNGQCSRRLRWVWLVADRAAGPGAGEARAALVRAAQQAPDAVRDLFFRPMVGAWAAALLGSGTPPDGQQLGALAVSAAQVAGTTAEAVVESRDGWVLLPGSGMLRAGSERPRLSTDGDGLRMDGRQMVPGDDWLVPRRLKVPGTPPLDILLDDVDPYRNRFHVAAAGRLAPAVLARWEEELAGAWRLLSRHAPQRAAEMAAGLHSLVPLHRPNASAAHSATSTTTVGVIGLNSTGDPAEMAIALVHEFQHSKLAALHDIEPLHRTSREAVFRVPWRADRRPLSGALQGLYAFTGVADTWRALRAEPHLAERAEFRFAEAVAFIREPAREIPTADALTSTGKRLADRLAAAVDELLSVPVSAAAGAAAEHSLAACRAGWES